MDVTKKEKGIYICKNLMIAGIKPAHEAAALEFMFAATPFISENDRDGLGYAAQNEKGVFGERWINPKEAFVYRTPFSKKDKEIKETFVNVLDGAPRYNKWGKVGKSFHALLLHARMATCAVDIGNTHPFVSEDGKTALIHNGIVRSYTLKNVTSTCDTELLLNSYVGNGVAKDPTAVQAMAKEIQGSYACGVLTVDAEGKQVMDIFRNNTSSLYAAYVKELDAIVYCTNIDIVRKTCRKLKWKVGSTFKFADNKIIRIEAKTGVMLTQHAFTVDTTYNHGYSGNYNHNYWSEQEKKSTALTALPGGKAVGDDTNPFHYEGEGYGRRNGWDFE